MLFSGNSNVFDTGYILRVDSLKAGFIFTFGNPSHAFFFLSHFDFKISSVMSRVVAEFGAILGS